MPTYQKIKAKLSQGSALVFSLLVLAILLASALAIGATTAIERKNSLTGNASIQAFQTADSGVEVLLSQLTKATGSTLDKVPGVTCDGGTNIARYDAGGTSGSYDITFFDSNTPTPNQLLCSSNLSNLDHVKSVGTYKNTTRAIQTAMAAGAVSGSITGGCTFGSLWGTATSCTTSAPNMTCAAGNTVLITGYFVPVGQPNQGAGQWNSVGNWANGFCMKN